MPGGPLFLFLALPGHQLEIIFLRLVVGGEHALYAEFLRGDRDRRSNRGDKRKEIEPLSLVGEANWNEG